MSSYPKAIEELSFLDILNGKKELLKEALPEVYAQLKESDPAIALLEVSAYSEGLLRNRINNSLLAVMVDYASGNDLDSLAKLYGVQRKLIKEADDNSIPVTEAVYESDEDLRIRIVDAPKGFSVAGPRLSYIHYGKLANDKVKDISASSPAPMEVDIAVLSYDGNGVASEELVAKVNEKLNAEDIRPMGDLVRVVTAEIVEFNIDVNIIFKDNIVGDKEGVLTQIKDNLKSYVEKEHRLSGVIALAGIYSACFINEDVIVDVVINSPLASIKTEPNQAPYCLNIEVAE